MEIWKNVPINPIYSVSNLGRCRNNNTGRILKPKPDWKGYLFLAIGVNKKPKTYYMHRLVMLTFFPIDDPKLYQVNHKDFDKKNNKLSNLEWVTQIENIKHALGRQRKSSKKILLIIRKLLTKYTEEELLKKLKNL